MRKHKYTVFQEIGTLFMFSSKMKKIISLILITVVRKILKTLDIRNWCDSDTWYSSKESTKNKLLKVKEGHMPQCPIAGYANESIADGTFLTPIWQFPPDHDPTQAVLPINHYCFAWWRNYDRVSGQDTAIGRVRPFPLQLLNSFCMRTGHDHSAGVESQRQKLRLSIDWDFSIWTFKIQEIKWNWRYF